MVVVTVTSLGDKIKFIESAFGPGRLARNSKNIEVRCPICAPRDPSKRKLAIRVDDDRCHCWTCGFKAHTLAPLLRKHAGRDLFVEYVTRFMPPDDRPHARRCLIIDAGPPPVALPKDFRLLALAGGSNNPDVKAVMRYVVERGLTHRDVWYYRLGVSDDPRWKRRVIVPSFDKAGVLNYYVGRTVDSRIRPKYDNPDIEDKLPIIFNEMNVDWTQRLVLCEGPFDMFKCGDNVVPLLGSTLNEESALFNRILTHSTPVALALDADMWETKTPRIAKKLAEYDVDVTIVDTRSMGDPGQATKASFAEALAAAAPMEWRDAFSRRLERAARS